MTPTQTKLLELASEVQKHAYAPYSKAYLGAALVTDKGEYFSGCNVENASYGGTVCAERIAIFKAVTEGALGSIKEILVVSHAEKPWPPCGLCRQVIAEFATAETVVHTANSQGQIKSFKFTELFPAGFTPDYLK